MSMQEPTDNQLDGLFRKSAEEFNVPYDPAAWQALKNRLDAHDRLTIWEHVLRWGLPVLLLVILTAGSWNANRKQGGASQLLNSSVAMGQSVSIDKAPQPNSAARHRQQRVESSRLHSNDTLTANLSKPDGILKDAIAQPHENERTVEKAQPDETVANPDESVVLSGSSKRGSTTKAMARSRRAGEPTTHVGQPSSTNTGANPSIAMNPVSEVSADVAKTGKLALTMSHAGRTRSGTARQRKPGHEVGNGYKNSLAATLSATANMIEPAKTFTKRRVTQNATGELVAKKQEGASRPLRAEQATEHSIGATTPPVSAQVTPEKGEHPALLVSFIELIGKPGQWAKPLSFNSRDVTAPENQIALATPKGKQSSLAQPVPVQKGMSVRFVVAPDLSGIGLKDLSRPGTNVGLLLEYRLASRWSVQAGVLRSTKVYKALTTEYKLPDYTAKWRVLPQSVNGRCNLLDIPLNLRYDVALRPRLNGQPPSRWFVSGGVTTYIMQKEDYDYVYAEADKSHVYPNMTGWHGKTGAYGFSQLNLSMGYEQALSQRLSWQVEPFVKVPLKGVGYYKIDLLSTGAFFSLRYKF